MSTTVNNDIVSAYHDIAGAHDYATALEDAGYHIENDYETATVWHDDHPTTVTMRFDFTEAGLLLRLVQDYIGGDADLTAAQDNEVEDFFCFCYDLICGLVSR